MVELQERQGVLKEAIYDQYDEVNRLYVRPTVQILAACIDPDAFLTIPSLLFFCALFPILSVATISLAVSSIWKILRLPAYALTMVDVALLIALYTIPRASLWFFTTLGLVAIAVEILSPSIRYSIIQGRCHFALARDEIRQGVIFPRKELHQRATQVAALLEIKDDQISQDIGSSDLKEPSGDAGNDVPDSKRCTVEHAQKTNRFDIEGWLLVVNATEPGLCTSAISMEAGEENCGPLDVGNGKMEENVEINR